MIGFKQITENETYALEAALQSYLSEIDPSLGTTETAQDFVKQAFAETERTPLWITKDDEPIGFALMWQEGDRRWNLAEFSVFPQYRQNGFGRRAAHALFAKHPGEWSFGVVSKPLTTRDFWASCLASFPNVRKGTAQTPFQCHSYTFTTPETFDD